MTSTTSAGDPVESAEQLPEDLRGYLRELILTLADNKRLLGIRYSDWMLGAPSLESGIAASSMAQDEWGHARLTYALLADFGDDPKTLEHERPATEYHAMEVLDSPLASWSEMIAANLLLDTAIAIQYRALVDSRYIPIHNRVHKLLDEETFHFQYAAGWAEQLAKSGIRREFEESLGRFLPAALRWLGRPDAEGLLRLQEDGLVRRTPDELRSEFLRKISSVLERAGHADQTAGAADSLDWSGWDDSRRRGTGGGPDAETLARVRGDRNRAMLLD